MRSSLILGRVLREIRRSDAKRDVLDRGVTTRTRVALIGRRIAIGDEDNHIDASARSILHRRVPVRGAASARVARIDRVDATVRCRLACRAAEVVHGAARRRVGRKGRDLQRCRRPAKRADEGLRSGLVGVVVPARRARCVEQEQHLETRTAGRRKWRVGRRVDEAPKAIDSCRCGAAVHACVAHVGGVTAVPGKGRQRVPAARSRLFADVVRAACEARGGGRAKVVSGSERRRRAERRACGALEDGASEWIGIAVTTVDRRGAIAALQHLQRPARGRGGGLEHSSARDQRRVRAAAWIT